MAFGTRAQIDTIRELAFGSISGSYATVGTPLTDHARLARIVNSTDAQVYISDDGVNNKLRLAANSYILFDFSANKIRDDGLFFPVGSQFYVKQVSGAPTTGSVWVEIVYATGGI